MAVVDTEEVTESSHRPKEHLPFCAHGTPVRSTTRARAPVIEEVESIAAERLSDVVDEFRQKSPGAKRRELYCVIVLEVAFIFQRPYPSAYLADHFGGLSDTLVGHSIGEQQDIVVETAAGKLHFKVTL